MDIEDKRFNELKQKIQAMVVNKEEISLRTVDALINENFKTEELEYRVTAHNKVGVWLKSLSYSFDPATKSYRSC
jgi:hypothetical protein